MSLAHHPHQSTFFDHPIGSLLADLRVETAGFIDIVGRLGFLAEFPPGLVL
jgi:hypothetical protein